MDQPPNDQPQQNQSAQDSQQHQPGGYQQPTSPPGYPQQGYPQQGYQQQGYPVPPPGYAFQPQYPEESGALVALLMSLLGLAVCSGLLCPVGWHLANKELTAITEGRRDPSKRDMAKAAQVIGIIGSLLLAIGLLFFVGFIALAVFGAAAGSAG